MVACILFLAGPGGVFLNSQVLYPDGGKSSILALSAIDTNPFRQHTRAACSYIKKRKPYSRQLERWHRSRNNMATFDQRRVQIKTVWAVALLMPHFPISSIIQSVLHQKNHVSIVQV